MAIRPSATWRDEVSQNADAAELYTPVMLEATDAALAAFEDEARSLGEASDERILAAVERVVEQLNTIDGEHGAFCTIEREDLCEYIDQVVTAQGIDVSDLLARQDMEELTERWRDW
ncbi:hypothetical protein OHA61_18095 [Streptomyces sp. NBC_00885]|uniref:hypothetical protein n=1 Tax=Streptomyces sp. NBC_00885 TaxID=2975857 RepID=UPI0038630964|nr:hypothetical protein OHA61_18095 [Streptomyces sp. NBC_00885]